MFLPADYFAAAFAGCYFVVAFAADCFAAVSDPDCLTIGLLAEKKDLQQQIKMG